MTYRPSTVVGSNKSAAQKNVITMTASAPLLIMKFAARQTSLHLRSFHFALASSLVTINIMKLTGAGGGGEQKRHRTHLSVAQIRVMRSCFRNCRNPSLSECEVMANAIGLEKRVVQVSPLLVHICYQKLIGFIHSY